MLCLQEARVRDSADEVRGGAVADGRHARDLREGRRRGIPVRGPREFSQYGLKGTPWKF